MRVALLSREYPPEVYGGAGVHVEYLARELRRLTSPPLSVDVHCFGADRPDAVAHRPDPGLVAAGANAALLTMSTDLSMVAAVGGVDLVHSHTWYANFAGFTASMLYGVPHVVTTHSLEPLRPWKAEQLGGGYALSSYCERSALENASAVIAVSGGMRDDVLKCYPSIDPDRVSIIHNGIDTAEYLPTVDAASLEKYGVDPSRPSVLFLGRIARQKGLPYLLAAARSLDPSAQLVLLAGSPDTPEIEAEVSAAIAELQQTRSGVIWIPEMVTRAETIAFLSAASVFVCPSIYEPMGIVNLEAMACQTPVVATATGGIPEVVDDGTTGVLVPIDPDPADPYGAPRDPVAFADALAEAINGLLADPARRHTMGQAGRRRAEELFSWSAIAERTRQLYASLL
jgi:alpha-maltose-1-phosphate synthase